MDAWIATRSLLNLSQVASNYLVLIIFISWTTISGHFRSTVDENTCVSGMFQYNWPLHKQATLSIISRFRNWPHLVERPNYLSHFDLALGRRRKTTMTHDHRKQNKTKAEKLVVRGGKSTTSKKTTTTTKKKANGIFVICFRANKPVKSFYFWELVRRFATWGYLSTDLNLGGERILTLSWHQRTLIRFWPIYQTNNTAERSC